MRLLVLALAAPLFAASAVAQVLPAPPHPCVLRVDEVGKRVDPASLDIVPTNTVTKQGRAAMFVVTYTGFTAEAQAAFQAAVDIWADHLDSAVPIRVSASFAELGPGVLGSAGPAGLAFNQPEFAFQGTVYPVALGEAITGRTLNSDTNPDITARFSSTFNFYFGTDGNPPSNRLDFLSVVLHELGHGLGFVGSAVIDDGEPDANGNDECEGDAGLGCFLNRGFPFVYDRFVEDADGDAITDATEYPEVTVTFANLLTSDQLYSSAPTVTATLGTRGRHFAPAIFQRGSSYSHWNETTFQGTSNALMTPSIGAGEAYQDPGANTCALFSDHGWPLGPGCAGRIFAARTAQVTGAEDWRMLAAPDDNASVGELLGSVWTQGFPGSNAPAAPFPNVYLYDESVPGTDELGYVAPASAATTLPLGRGVFAFLYEDDDPNTPVVDGGFPKTLAATGTPASTDFGWGADGAGLLSYTANGTAADDGWNLLGNPFGVVADWDTAERSGVNDAVYVYDASVSDYREYAGGAGDLTDGLVAPFQGFWVQANAATPGLTLASVPAEAPLLRTEPLAIALRLRGTGDAVGSAESGAMLLIGTPGATEGRDAFDAWALESPAAVSLALATVADGDALAVDHRPAADGRQEIELTAALVGAQASDVVLSWPGLDAGDTRVTLRDRETGTEIDLTTAGEYAFALTGSPARTASTPAAPRPLTVDAARSARFTLVVDASSVVAGESAPTAVVLSAIAPNPVRRRAALRLTVPATERVRAAVYDALGRQVAVLHDGDVTGAAEITLDASELSSGVYIVRVVGESFAETQTLTVAR